MPCSEFQMCCANIISILIFDHIYSRIVLGILSDQVETQSIYGIEGKQLIKRLVVFLWILYCALTQ